ncbi:MAG: hypothetical protein LBH13_07730 [Cellulomonadaceae bacterium]|jgi:hypothetical protein|nr:hypothetical protein [Cellulomonadaceae bacterium]
MGSRAAIFIKSRDGSLNAYFDRTAAQHMAINPVVAGHQGMRAKYAEYEPLDLALVDGAHAFQWLDGGGLLIDEVNRVVMWCAEPDTNPLPRISNYLYEVTWSGWTAVWSPVGPEGIAAYLGVPVELMGACHTMGPSSIPGYVETLARTSGHHGPVVVRLSSHQSVCVFVDSIFADFPEIPVENILSVAQEASDDPVEMTVGCDRGEGWGALVDPSTRTVQWWSIDAYDRMQPYFSRHWPGWSAEAMGDDFEWLTPWLPPHVTLKADWQDLIDNVRRTVTSPWLYDADENLRARTLEALSSLEEQPMLPPCRYVDYHGVIHSPGE